ncbi:MFS sugar transporter [Aspergillus niger CBS 101883]|uniref:MFS sugar transporter n=1 Tax=Aspergillus niger ATCC 13496 TaxID=1353008 RepID=A0A370C380_ASPNG|nr:MFS sugar transporter [Aspergillus niger CBS 513.88]XP_025459393.1 MFS sugar transporter [Aspergillus niger CBS 101883]PYH61338.1 MFS sugar transporter [Aspergillus niger CBS 101883]RDH21509.1 MFS sugar transporter [Aspergillus niger ATCC 13496]|eukprot:XP_001397963.2 MFS sugar transporter [Aspergillus niger CBS 513.88]
MSKRIPNLFNLLLVIYVALGSTACSYGLAVIGTTVAQPSFYSSMGLAQSGEPGYSRTTRYLGAFNGLNAAGAAVGTITNAFIADLLSRKRTISIGAILQIIGAALCAGAVNVSMFMAGRFISGWGIGILISVIPMYQSEISTPEARGFMVSIHGIMIAIGYTLSGWIGFGVYFITASGSTSTFPWRFPLAFQIAPVLLLLVGSPWVPYSPRWLLMKGRKEEALEVMKRLHAKKGETENTDALREYHQLVRQVDLDREVVDKRCWYEVVRTPANRRRALIASLLMWGDMFMGSLVIANYGVILFGELGLSGYMPLLCLGIYVTITIPGNTITALYLDRLGRRTFLLIGTGGIGLCLVLETLMQGLYMDSTNDAGKRAAIFFIFLYIFFWSTCMDATQFVYLSEIFPTHLRSQGVAVGMFSYFAASIILLVAGPIAMDNIGWRFMLVFAVPTCCYWFAIYFLFPETAGRSLEDINAGFGDPVAVNYFNATAEEIKEFDAVMHVENANGA